MNGAWQLQGCAARSWAPAEIGPAYCRRFNWGEGRRLPDECKAVHLACADALSAAGLSVGRNLGGRVAVVLAGAFTGLSNYECFRAGLAPGADLKPLAFSFSLPGVPVSVLSLYYGITGPVLSLSAAVASAGSNALETGIGLLQSDLCDVLIAGSWYFPSVTARRCTGLERATAAIAVIGRRVDADPGLGLRVAARADPAALASAGPTGDPLHDWLSWASAALPGGSRALPLGERVLVAFRDDRQWP